MFRLKFREMLEISRRFWFVYFSCRLAVFTTVYASYSAIVHNMCILNIIS